MTTNQELQNLVAKSRLKVALGRMEPDISELAQQVRRGLAAPIGFPRLSEFLFSGDRVVIAVNGGINGVELVLEPLLENLTATLETDTASATVLFADRESEARFEQQMKIRSAIARSAVHEGTADAALAVLGADDSHHPILISRFIFDADVLIPVTRAEDSRRAVPSAALLPFVDSATQKRWQGMSIENQAAYTEFICSLAGAYVSVDVVVGPGDIPQGVVIGQTLAKASAVREMISGAWQLRTLGPCDALVISIDDPRDANSWQSIRDAIVVAGRIAPRCPLIILSSIDHPPPNELRGVFSLGDSPRKATSDFDSTLRQSLQGRPVFLRSRLADEIVREISWAPIQAEQSIEYALSTYRVPVLLRDPQRCLEADDAAPASDQLPKPTRSKRKRSAKRGRT